MSENNVKKRGNRKTNCKFKTVTLSNGETDMVIDRGPGTICWIYILLIVISTITQIGFNKVFKKKLKEDKKTFFKIIVVIKGIFEALFMYYMCYICRGFVGFIILLLVNLLYSTVLLPYFWEDNNTIE